jgi:hypothetical protein
VMIGSDKVFEGMHLVLLKMSVHSRSERGAV